MNIQRVKVEVLLPEESIEKMRDELNACGVLNVGNYDHVLSYSYTKGYWRPLKGSNPVNGTIGELSSGTECKMAFTCNFEQMEEVKRLINEVHPYDEPVIYFIPLL